MLNAFGQFVDGGVEGLSPAQSGGIGHRPVQTSQFGGQLLMGIVTDGDDEVAGRHDVPEISGRARAQLQVSAASGADRTGMYTRAGVGARRTGRQVAAPVPDRCGELAARGVLGTDEDHAVRLPLVRRHPSFEG